MAANGKTPTNPAHDAPHEMNPGVARGLKDIYDCLVRAQADIGMANYGLANEQLMTGIRRMKHAIEYFGGRVD